MTIDVIIQLIRESHTIHGDLGKIDMELSDLVALVNEIARLRKVNAKLLKACKRVIGSYDQCSVLNGNPIDTSRLDDVRAAIAKAEWNQKKGN